MNNITTNIVLSLAAVTGLLVFQGCSSKNTLGTVKVSGMVTLDGEPVGGVTVAFLPNRPEGGRECYGATDTQGRFVLTIPGTVPGSGAIPGEYIVTFIKMLDPTEGLTDAEIQRKFPSGLQESINLLPEKYRNRTTTDIAPVTVEQRGKNEFIFEMFSN